MVEKADENRNLNSFVVVVTHQLMRQITGDLRRLIDPGKFFTSNTEHDLFMGGDTWGHV